MEWALSELRQVLADRADDPHARAALDALRDAFCVAESRANSDPLTGLMNRSTFAQALEQVLADAARSQTQAALMFMDLDGFKSINDEQGHLVGDQLLKHVAGRIMSCVRDDDLLARYGGDEFVVLLEGLVDTEVVDAIASRIIDALSAPFSLDGLCVRLSISIGVALFPSHALTAEALLQRADLAMYRAKHAGGKRYLVWSRERDDQSGSYAKLESSQRSTSATDNPLRRA